MGTKTMTHNAGIALALLLWACAPTLLAQENKEFDNTVGLFPPQPLGPAPSSVMLITTPDGFDNFDLGVDFAEPHMSMNPKNPLQFFNAWNINSTHYTQNGYDWTTAAPNFGVPVNGDPVTAYDSLGNLYYETMFGGITGCKVMRSTNNGQTWSAAVTSIDGVDKNWIAADQTAGPYANYVYTTMTASVGGNFARSTDFGATWTTTFSPSTQSLPGMMVAVGPNVLAGNNISGGCVYVVTNSGSSTAATFTFYRSTDGGATFGAAMSTQNFAGFVGTFVGGRNSVEGVRTRPYPFITADNSYGPFRGRLYLVYTSNAPAGDGNKPDVYCRYSTNQGATWSGPVTINDDPSSQNNHNWFPSTWCDKQTGRLYVKWYDSRNSFPADDSTDVYASYSDDGGATFVTNQRLTNKIFKTSCSTCGGGGNPRYQGDYDAITSSQYGGMAVWTDFRSGNFGSYVAYFPDFAMRVSPSVDTLSATDSTNAVVTVPAVKLYTGTAKFSATVSPAAGFTFTFLTKDSLTSYPDSLTMRIKTTGVAPGTYTVTVTGKGPSGTPVHKRSVTIVVQVLLSSVTLTAPNGGETWPIGSSQSIQWSSSNITGKIKVMLSRNGGSTFPEVLFDSTTNDGAENWTVTGPVSSTARIRISSIVIPSAADTSNANFNIVQPVVTVTAPNGGESWPISSSQSIQWSSANFSGKVKVMLSRNGGSTFPEILFDSTNNDGAQSWAVTGPVSATARIRISSIVIPSVADTSNANFSIGTSVSFQVLGSWNMLSVPVTVPDLRKTQVFPGSKSDAYAFESSAGYVVRDTLRYTEGYWLKYPSSQMLVLVGEARTMDTVHVVQGWNMVGSISSPVDIDSITQIPSGIVASSYYLFNGSGYVVADSIHPARSYWVKANQPGMLVLKRLDGPGPVSRPSNDPYKRKGP